MAHTHMLLSLLEIIPEAINTCLPSGKRRKSFLVPVILGALQPLTIFVLYVHVHIAPGIMRLPVSIRLDDTVAPAVRITRSLWDAGVVGVIDEKLHSSLLKRCASVRWVEVEHAAVMYQPIMELCNVGTESCSVHHPLAVRFSSFAEQKCGCYPIELCSELIFCRVSKRLRCVGRLRLIVRACCISCR